MVWFQCEDCGENLKKPKLQNHFRGCSAQKLSCIDCGVVFNQQSVQTHTKCISEAEKYGPKNLGCIKKELGKSHSKEQSFDDLDTSIGLSTKAPWYCSLCNVKATSQDTLILHSQGKKHRSKVRSTLSNGNPTPGKTFTVSSSGGLANGITLKDSLCKEKGPSNGDYNEQTPSPKRRKLDTQKNGSRSFALRKERVCGDGIDGMCRASDEVVVKDEQSQGADSKKGLSVSAESTQLAPDNAWETWSSTVKWKKIIRKTLNNAPSGSMKIKKLIASLLPLVMDTIKSSGLEVDKDFLLIELDKQIRSYPKLTIDRKMVSLKLKGGTLKM